MSTCDPRDLLRMQKGSIVDFENFYLLQGFPVKGLNMLEGGPYIVMDRVENTDTVEFSLEGVKANATLEVEEDGSELIILIQTSLSKYPSVLSQVRRIWAHDCTEFELNGVTYYLTEDDDDEDEDGEHHYWDYYSNPIDEGNKLYIGVMDYGDDDAPEVEFYVGFELPPHALKDPTFIF